VIWATRREWLKVNFKLSHDIGVSLRGNWAEPTFYKRLLPVRLTGRVQCKMLDHPPDKDKFHS